MSGNGEILVGREGSLATLIINRPRALNALTLDNYRHIDPTMRTWAADPSVHAVAIRGAGDRAFCAGGDVRVHQILEGTNEIMRVIIARRLLGG